MVPGDGPITSAAEPKGPVVEPVLVYPLETTAARTARRQLTSHNRSPEDDEPRVVYGHTRARIRYLVREVNRHLGKDTRIFYRMMAEDKYNVWLGGPIGMHRILE